MKCNLRVKLGVQIKNLFNNNEIDGQKQCWTLCTEPSFPQLGPSWWLALPTGFGWPIFPWYPPCQQPLRTVCAQCRGRIMSRLPDTSDETWTLRTCSSGGNGKQQKRSLSCLRFSFRARTGQKSFPDWEIFLCTHSVVTGQVRCFTIAQCACVQIDLFIEWLIGRKKASV